MKLLHLSDLHFRRDYQTSNFTNPLFSMEDNPTTRLIHLLEELPLETFSLVFITGDLVHEGSAEDYKALKELLDQYLKDIPYFFCRGNHDRIDPFREGLGITMNQQDEYIQRDIIDGFQIISLDSAQETHHEGKLSIHQMAQLEEWLAEPTENGTFLLQHHPLAWEESEIATQTPEGFGDLIKNSDILGIFVGHIHQSTLAMYYGKPQYMTEALSFGVDEFPNESIFTDRSGYSIFSYDGSTMFRYNYMISPKQTQLGRVSKPIIGNH